MVEILNAVKHDIDITSGLNENQVFALNQILLKYKEKNEEEKILNSSLIIDKIEDVVNFLYKQGKIKTIEIKQITETEYEFNSVTIVLSLEVDKLIVEKANITLEEWLLQNFGVGPSTEAVVQPKSTTSTGAKKEEKKSSSTTNIQSLKKKAIAQTK